MQYKISKFVKNYKIRDSICLYHTLSQEIIFINKKIYNKNFLELVDRESKLYYLMKKLKFLVFSREDEIVLKNILHRRKKSGDNYSLLRILMTDHCNLNCSYCKVENNIKNKNCTVISKKDVILALKLFQKISPQNNKLVSITGGEPLLFPEKVKEIVEMSKIYLSNYWIILFTNATLVNNSVAKYLKKERILTVVSLDGSKKNHNKLRVFYNGKGSYSKVMAGYKLLKKNGCKIGFSCTVGRHNLDNLVKEFSFIIENFKPDSIGINPLKYPSHKTTSCIYLPSPIKYAHSLSELHKKAAEKGIFLEQIYRKVEPFVEKNFKYYDCGACGKNINLDADGSIGPCKSFLILKTLYQKNKNKLDNKIFGKLLSRSTLNNKKCLECEAIAICGGGCAYESYVETGSYNNFSSKNCLISKSLLSELLKYTFELNKIQIDNGLKQDNFYYINNLDRTKICGKIKTKPGTLAYSVGHLV